MRAICSIMVLGCFGELHGKYHEKIEIEHVICSIVVLSRFDEFHVKYHEKCRQNLLFVASWY